MPTQSGIELYERLRPLYIYEGRNVDEENGFALRTICYSLGAMFAESELLSRDTVDDMGYSILLDVDRCPAYGLPWLALFVGETIPASATEAEARDIIRDHLGWDRGTLDAIVRAAKKTLTGTKTVRVIERDTSAYKLTIITDASETTDAAVTEAAIREQLPVGIILTYLVEGGELFNEAIATFDGAGSATIDSTLTTPV